MKKTITINRHNVRHNKKVSDGDGLSCCQSDDLKPVISVKTYKKTIYGDSVVIKGQSRLVYRPEKPLKCGATCWIETESDVWVDGIGYV